MGVLKFDTKKCSSCYQQPVLSHELFKSERTPIRFHSKFVNLLLIVICVLFSLLCVRPAHAAGNVATMTVWNTIGVYAVSQCNTPVTYNPTYSAAGLCVENVYMSYNCSGTAGNCISNWVITSITPTSATECYTINSMDECIIALAKQAVCPSNSSGSPCTCNTSFEPDATGTSCVPVPVATCPVHPLNPLDPAAQPYEDGLVDMANETDATRAGAACIVREARARHLHPQIESGYRPPEYQTHIREVYDKWQLLQDNNDSVCADTKVQVELEYMHHSPFSHQPGETSLHSSRLAVDIHLSDYTDADTIAAGCNMSKPVANDRSHFESKR
jgi:hypothetical protein